ncbi:preprotein translocase subunit YajC [Vulcanibacillus modesticaldus]|uniref:Preprotein translocase subunit YajC n=1 Tax=Vulcanibacillus modesticaldus TaxID=337097 RepID=A0A1D2YX65_9BACI|nr:preprotein translocase subunit YajC [Vulcanibacillus modesticaldus]OEG00213.1 preprotein translocase subunit YajC [Vulcanibacillus modesticaldus]
MFNLAEATTTGASPWGSIIWLVAMFAIFYLFLIRPQQKRNKKRNQMLSELKKNDKVITIGGIHGTIVDLTDDKVVLRVNETTKLTFDRGAINGVIENK